MTTLLAALIVFGVLITVHELGHFAAAKLVGMQVDEFAIGFGPKLYQTEEKGTVYTLRALPLGDLTVLPAWSLARKTWKMAFIQNPCGPEW